MINLHERMLPSWTRDLLVSSQTVHPTEPPRPALLPVNVCKIGGWVAKHLEPDQMPQNVFFGPWSGTTLFALACLSKYVE